MKQKRPYKKPSFYVISSAMDGDKISIDKILDFYDPYISKSCIRPLYDLSLIHILVDDTVNADNLYSKYPLSNYQLDFYVDNSWSGLPCNLSLIHISREKIVWFPKIYYQMDNGLLHILCEITMGKYQEQLLSLEDKLESGPVSYTHLIIFSFPIHGIQ